MSEITWQSRALSRAVIENILGADWVARFFVMSREAALAKCAVRATGAWDANMREHYAAYLSLAALLKGG